MSLFETTAVCPCSCPVKPYNEMNGYWFWWGGRTGKYITAQLCRQLFDRMV
ncbi:MAG: hypothetical protein GX419_03815 [Bacteroidales bacterium]|nr:hypothetical protein [Bacteroidales bacterium]